MIKVIDDELYEIICEWWKERQWPCLPKELLGKKGYVSFVNDKPIYAGWLFKDEHSTYGLLEWIVSTPHATNEERFKGWYDLMDHVAKVGQEIGITHLMTYATNENPKYKDRLTKTEFVTTDPNCSLFMRYL